MIVYTVLCKDSNGVPVASLTASLEQIHLAFKDMFDNANLDDERIKLVLDGETTALDARIVSSDYTVAEECDFDEFLHIKNSTFVDYRSFLQWFNVVGGIDRENKE